MAIHEREPCFFCEQRERAHGQILCEVCLAWAEVARGAEEYRRAVNTVIEIERTLRLYDVPIMAPLADSVLSMAERIEILEDLLRQCYRVVGNSDLAKKIEEAIE